ncbi:hypothetical protein C4D60_Mb03t15880 [Musa balbisiana]|uniref:Uncharacterized protein n=1 Tax=Musa balbisiana TaxID=52838 RepID=A0A4S8JAA1_MUSBA|nr:hypothetical protein C4D60_Mb03t15880 [Musa balbisiana]
MKARVHTDPKQSYLAAFFSSLRTKAERLKRCKSDGWFLSSKPKVVLMDDSYEAWLRTLK